MRPAFRFSEKAYSVIIARPPPIGKQFTSLEPYFTENYYKKKLIFSGVHRGEKRHGSPVRHEIHEQSAVPATRCHGQCSQRSGDSQQIGASVPSQSLVLISRYSFKLAS